MADNAINLDRNWFFREVEPGELADFAARVLPARLGRDGWMPATVPGAVHLDLIAAGEIDDPYRGARERRSWSIEKTDYVYRTTFLLPDAWARGLDRPHSRIMLSFEALDTYAAIYLNGDCVFESSNWFLPLRLEVTERLRPGENTLVVHFESSVRRGGMREQEFGRLDAEWDRTRVYNRRPQYLTGTSATPRISGCGIPGRVVLRRLEHLRLRHINVPVNELTANWAKVVVEADIEAFVEADAEIHCTVEKLEPIGSGTNYRSTPIDEKIKPAKVKAGTFRFAHKVQIDHAVLWWPLGHGPEALGRRTLYRARVVARVDGKTVDEQECLFGLRTTELVADDGAEGFRLRINGQPVFARGATWMPPDMFPGRVDDEHLRDLLDLAAGANVNLLRVWGGGLYESDAFYRRCDELGIMVWQDFPFLRGDYPDHQAFWQNVQREATSQIRRLRTHPSLVLWCGNDEKSLWDATHHAHDGRARGARIFSRLLPELVKEYSPGIPYWESSPSGGEKPNDPRKGDHRSEVWDAWESPDRYRESDARFVSKFGFQALPCLDTIREFTAADDPALNHADFDAHQKQEEGNARILRHVISQVRPPESFDELVYLSQWVQANAIATGVNAWRARRPDTMGAVVWHFNDSWPGVSWSVVDHARRPKLAYWALRQAFSPVSLVLQREDDERFRAIVVNDGRKLDGDQKLVCRIKAYKLDGELVEWTDVEIDVAMNGRTEVGRFGLESLGIREPESCVVTGELYGGRTVIATAFYSPVEPRRAKYEEPQLEARLDCVLARRRAVILVRATNIVRGVEIGFGDIPDARIRFDNAFDIWPSREVWVNAEIPGDLSREALVNSVRFRCLNDAVPGRRVQWRPLPLAEGEGFAETQPEEDSGNLAARLRMTDVVRKLTD